MHTDTTVTKMNSWVLRYLAALALLLWYGAGCGPKDRSSGLKETTLENGHLPSEREMLEQQERAQNKALEVILSRKSRRAASEIRAGLQSPDKTIYTTNLEQLLLMGSD